MKLVNRRARYDYQILHTYEAGIKLTGPEVKSVRGERMSFLGSFVKIIGSEAYLVNALIPLYEYARPTDYDERRTRKLLLHKKELLVLKQKLQTGNFALVPLSVYTKKGLIKLEIGLGKGKKAYEKRETIKKRDLQRAVEQEVGERV